jgi:hypothetical protein
MVLDWKDENELWDFQAPRLRGWWRRLEAAYPEGLPDSFGLWGGETHWLERKVGKPSRDALRPKQIEFGLQCLEKGISYHVCFGYKGEVLFFKDFSFTGQVYPRFWVPPRERLAQVVHQGQRQE